MTIFESFDEGWRYTKKHGILLSLLLLIIYFFFNYLSSKCFPAEFWDQYTKIVTSGSKDMFNELMNLAPYFEQASIKIWLVYILQFLVLTGVLNIALSIHIGETKGFSLKYLSLPFQTYLKMIQFGCLMFLVMIVSLYLAFIPFIYLGIRLMFVIPLLLEDPGCSTMLAVQKSWKMTRGDFFNLFGFFMLCIVVLIIGLICLCVGVFVAWVVCMFAFLAIYGDKKRLTQPSQGEGA